MQDPCSRKEKQLYYSTLTCLIKAMEGKITTIDLRNDNFLTGLIKKVDGFMNIDMEKVHFFDSYNNETFFENFFITARNIRYVHVPKECRSDEFVNQSIEALYKPKNYKNKKTFKQSRAEKYHKNILNNLANPEPGPSTSLNC